MLKILAQSSRDWGQPSPVIWLPAWWDFRVCSVTFVVWSCGLNVTQIKTMTQHTSLRLLLYMVFLFLCQLMQ